MKKLRKEPFYIIRVEKLSSHRGPNNKTNQNMFSSFPSSQRLPIFLDGDRGGITHAGFIRSLHGGRLGVPSEANGHPVVVVRFWCRAMRMVLLYLLQAAQPNGDGMSATNRVARFPQVFSKRSRFLCRNQVHPASVQRFDELVDR
jgi:hypothetical protein